MQRIVPTVLAASILVVAYGWPTPPMQTVNQRAANNLAHRVAKDQSDRATPSLLHFLDSAAVKNELTACCPHLVSLPAVELLTLIRSELRAAELVHNFDPRPQLPPMYPGMPGIFGQPYNNTENLHVVTQLDFVPNLYQTGIVAGDPMSAAAANLEGKAETSIFGLPEFTSNGSISWNAAADRFPYVALNWAGVDMGNPKFGPISYVFRQSTAKYVQVAPIDTGIWESVCNTTAMVPGANATAIFNLPEVNCSTPLSQVGTLEPLHLDHVLMSAFGLWGNQTSAAAQVARWMARGPLGGSYDAQPNMTFIDTIKYLEADVIANVALESGVRFVIAHFALLFGTAYGTQLQGWCKQNGWALLWAYGPDAGLMYLNHPMQTTYASDEPNNQRLLDPSVNILNATEVDLAAWNGTWQHMQTLRTTKGPSSSQLASMWTELKMSQTTLAPQRADSCVDLDNCVGITAARDCVCYA